MNNLAKLLEELDSINPGSGVIGEGKLNHIKELADKVKHDQPRVISCTVSWSGLIDEIEQDSWWWLPDEHFKFRLIGCDKSEYGLTCKFEVNSLENFKRWKISTIPELDDLYSCTILINETPTPVFLRG